MDIDPEVGEDNIFITPASEVVDDDDIYQYSDLPVILEDDHGQIAIFNPLEFATEFDCVAVRTYKGAVLVLKSDTHQWVQVDAEKKNNNLKSIK